MAKINPLNKTMKICSTDLNICDSFQFNLLSEDIEFRDNVSWAFDSYKGKQFTDEDITQLRYYLGTVHEWEPAKSIICEACYLVSQKHRFHPVKDYIESEKWDGVPRIDEWLIHSLGAEDNIYIRHASSKILIASVNRIYNPGCKFDHMMILEGAQGLGKSTLVEELAGDWFLDTNFNSHDKDLIDSIRNAFVVEISELSGMNKKEVEWLKSFLTRKVDRVRLPYAARSRDFKRKCIFIGTYNPSGNNHYLRDDTGNRRFWCIECNTVNIDYIRQNKKQLWAEAYIRYKNGEQYHITNKQALEIMVSMHEERELESPTFYMIRDYLRANPHIESINMLDLLHDCLKINTDGKAPRELLSASTTVGIIMRKLKWVKGTNKNRDKYYKPTEQGVINE